jgi:hypothetical protein
VPDEKTDMNALMRRAAFGESADAITDEFERRKKQKSDHPTDMSKWLRTQYLRSRGITVPNDNDEEGDTDAPE